MFGARRSAIAERQRELRAATVLVKHFTHLLPHSPNPEAALHHFHEYLGELFRRPSWPDELASLERPEVLEALARLLGVSDFLWDDFLRMQYANLFPVVPDVDALATGKTKAQLGRSLPLRWRTLPRGDRLWTGGIAVLIQTRRSRRQTSLRANALAQRLQRPRDVPH